jgi:hypothetical protein
VNSRDEIHYGDQLPPGLGGRLVVGFVTATFLAAIVGTGIADVVFPVEGIKAIGMEARAQRRAASVARLRDGSLARLFEDDLRRHSRVRELVLPSYAFFMFFYLDQAPSEVTVGKEHWMFRTRRVQLSPQSDAVLANSGANSIVALDRRLLGQGIELTVLPVPRKIWVARNFLPRGVEGRLAVDDLLVDELKRRGISTVDLRELFTVADPREIYFKVDTHWTPRAARLAAMESVRLAGLLQEEPQRAGELHTVDRESGRKSGRAMLRSLGVDPEALDLTALDLRAPSAQRVTFGAGLERWMRVPSSMSRLALAGTSFSKNEGFARFLTHYCGERVMDGAISAQPYTTSIHRLLRKYLRSEKRPELEHLFWEFPLASVFNDYSPLEVHFGRDFGRCFQVLAPAVHQSWRPLPGAWEAIELRRVVHLGERPVQLLAMAAGALAHSGDGVALLHLAGEVSDAPLTLRLRHDGVSMEFTLRPGSFDFAWPILARGPTSGAMQLVAYPSQATRIKLLAASVSHEPVGSGRFELHRRGAGEWTELVAAKPILLGRRAAVQMQCSPDQADLKNIAVEIWLEGQEHPRRILFESLRPGGAILLDLGPEAQGLLERIRLQAAGGVLGVSLAKVSSGA